MEEILHQLISDLPHSVQVFYHPKWCNNFLPPTVGFYCGYSVIPIYPEMMLGLTSIFVAPGIKNPIPPFNKKTPPWFPWLQRRVWKIPMVTQLVTLGVEM